MEDHLAGVGGKVLQEQPFRPRKLHQFLLRDHPPLQIDLDVVEGEDPGTGQAPDDRRSTARTRAASSSGWNGLAM